MVASILSLIVTLDASLQGLTQLLYQHCIMIEVAMMRQYVVVKDQSNNMPECYDIPCGIAAPYCE